MPFLFILAAAGVGLYFVTRNEKKAPPAPPALPTNPPTFSHPPPIMLPAPTLPPGTGAGLPADCMKGLETVPPEVRNWVLGTVASIPAGNKDAGRAALDTIIAGLVGAGYTNAAMCFQKMKAGMI